MANHKNRVGFRFCNKCHNELALSPDNFPRDKNRLYGFSYQCHPCARSKPKRARPTRYRKLTAEGRAAFYARQLRYAKGRGWANHKVSQYRGTDRRRGFTNDIDAAWFRENIQKKACHYCGENQERCGADRIANTAGHAKNNVVPCCHDCNTSRMNRFSYAEMLILGKAIKEIKQLRVLHHS